MNLTALFLIWIFESCACSENFVDRLFENYSSMIKPRKNQSEVVHVNFYFTINSVQEVEERMQYISFFGWFNVQWYDEFLTWNHTQNSGLEMITVPYQKLWTPDISMWYTEKGIHGLEPHPYVTVSSNGHVTWYPGGKIILSCDIKVSRFPFDEQQCEIIVSAWQVTDWVQKLVPKSRTDDDSKIISQNGEWIFVKFTFTIVYEPEFHLTTVVYVLHFIRRYLYIVLTIFVPIIILAVLNSLTFFVPVHSGERITYSLTLFLTFTVFLTLFEETMPRNSTDVPYLTIYVGFHLLLCVISTIISVLLKPIIKPITHHDQAPNTEMETKEQQTENERSNENDKPLEFDEHDVEEGRNLCGYPQFYKKIDKCMILFNITALISSTVILFIFYYI
ncbi:acetylcholine receptor subunit alpha-like [Saccostrea echinata]|uniref:acetylcholine receptor subunit alpha-like n=1 Tax=Saccostrea echinata TaxID=191078 RepID=UPI002A8235CF|nr:acetylcholine receptor subunit alpha-like [Saccostrea echinata]